MDFIVRCFITLIEVIVAGYILLFGWFVGVQFGRACRRVYNHCRYRT